MRFTDGREPDLLSLPLFVDAVAPAALELGVRRMTTVELTVYLRARPAPGWLAYRTLTRYLADGYFEEDAELWDSARRHDRAGFWPLIAIEILRSAITSFGDHGHEDRRDLGIAPTSTGAACREPRWPRGAVERGLAGGGVRGAWPRLAGGGVARGAWRAGGWRVRHRGWRVARRRRRVRPGGAWLGAS